MYRPAHGGTTRPGPARPGNGYGRPLRARPPTVRGARIDASFWLERELEFELRFAADGSTSSDVSHRSVASESR